MKTNKALTGARQLKAPAGTARLPTQGRSGTVSVAVAREMREFDARLERAHKRADKILAGFHKG